MPTTIRSSPTDGRTNSFSPSSRNLFILGDFNCHRSLWDSIGTSDPHGEKIFDWVISSVLLPSMTLTHLPFYIAPLAVAPLQTSSLLPPSLPFLAPGRCFRTWVVITYQFFCLSLSLRSFAPMSVLLSLTFRNLAGMALPPLSFCIGILVSFSFLCCCSLYLSGTECGQIFHSLRSHQTPS